MTVADVDASSAVEFHYSSRRHRVVRIAILVAVAAYITVYLVLSGGSWGRVLTFGFIGVVAVTIARAYRGRLPRLPLRLTDEGLQLTRPDGITLIIDWANVGYARVGRGLNPMLVVEPVNPRRTRPPLEPYEWSIPGEAGPYELRVWLAWMTPGRDVLRRELARRLPIRDR